MREIRSYGSVGVRGGNEPLYPENPQRFIPPTFCAIWPGASSGLLFFNFLGTGEIKIMKFVRA
jgi:hypothetical protein